MPRHGPEDARAVIAGSPRLFPNPRLYTHQGAVVRFYDDLVRRRLVLIGFAYTRCEGSCPASLQRLLATRHVLGHRLERPPDVLTLTLDPDHDTPTLLGRFVAAHGSPGGWTCLTGAAPDLERLRRFLGFYDPDPRVDADRSQHGALVAMGDDRTGRWRVASTRCSAEELARLVLRTAGLPPLL